MINRKFNATGSQKISCLLGHSAAFDTIDHNMLITINLNLHGSVLQWFKSFYVSDRCFHVKCEKFLFLSYLLLWCSSRFCSWSVGPLLFILYTTPLSTLISSLSLNHHLYADDTQLFFSFYPSDLESSITHLQNALQQISSV